MDVRYANADIPMPSIDMRIRQCVVWEPLLRLLIAQWKSPLEGNCVMHRPPRPIRIIEGREHLALGNGWGEVERKHERTDCD